MANPRNPLVKAFPFGLETRREIALVEALDTAQEAETDLPNEDRAQMAKVTEVKEALMGAVESDQYGEPDATVVQPKYVDTRSSWSGFIDIVNGKAKMRPKNEDDDRPRLAKELADVLFKEKDDAPKFLKLPAIDLWVEGQHKLRVIQKRFMTNIRKLGLEEDLEVILENHNDLGKALRITERPEPAVEEEKTHELREDLRKEANIFIIGLTNLKLKKPEWGDRVDRMLAPLDEFRPEPKAKKADGANQGGDNNQGGNGGGGSQTGNPGAGVANDDGAAKNTSEAQQAKASAPSSSSNPGSKPSSTPSSAGENNGRGSRPAESGERGRTGPKTPRTGPMETGKSFAACMAAGCMASEDGSSKRPVVNGGSRPPSASPAGASVANDAAVAKVQPKAKARKASKARRKSAKRRR